MLSPLEMDELLERGKTLADLQAWSDEARKRATPAALTDRDVNLLVHEALTE